MLTRFTKEKLSRRKLTQVDGNMIPEEPALMRNLKMLQEDQLQVDYDYSGSDITDPFEESNESQTARDLKKARKKFSKLENNFKLMNSFSEEFKKTMVDVRKEMQLASSMGYEDMEEVERTLKAAVCSEAVPDELKRKLEEALKDEEHLHVGPDNELPARAAETCRAGGHDVMSSMWGMLATSKDLVVSPAGFDSQRQRSPHWLDNPPADWKRLDESKTKCERWIQNNI